MTFASLDPDLLRAPVGKKPTPVEVFEREQAAEAIAIRGRICALPGVESFRYWLGSQGWMWSCSADENGLQRGASVFGLGVDDLVALLTAAEKQLAAVVPVALGVEASRVVERIRALSHVKDFQYWLPNHYGDGTHPGWTWRAEVGGRALGRQAGGKSELALLAMLVDADRMLMDAAPQAVTANPVVNVTARGGVNAGAVAAAIRAEIAKATGSPQKGTV